MGSKAWVLSIFAVLGATCWSGEPEKRDFLGIAGDKVLELDAQALEEIDADVERFDELDEIFTAALAERANLPRGRWEGFRHPFFFRVMLVQTAMNGERTCEDRRRCAELDADDAPVDAAQCSPEVCDRQHAEAMTACRVILAQRCPDLPVLQGKCDELRRSAYQICTTITDCQVDCCNRSCSGENCALWATGKPTVEPCTDC